MSLRLQKILVWLGLMLAGPAVAYVSPGQPSGWVNDFAGVLTVEQKQALEQRLEQFSRDTSNEISVVFVNSLEGDTIENFAEKLFQEWGIGQAKKDNGVLLLVAIADRALRIEVGYGLEGALTDAQSAWIIRDILQPAFRQNDYYGGVSQAVDKIMAATQGEYLPEVTESAQLPLDFDWAWFVFFIFIWLGAILGRSQSWWLGGVVGAVAALFIGLFLGWLYWGLIALAVLVPFGLLFDFIVSRQYQRAKAQGKSMPWWIGGGRGGMGGGFGGFGGFGGGHSGGGGASGRW